MTIPQGTLASEERLEWMLSQLGVEGAVTIAGAAETLRVSEMTVRRDLVELEARGLVRRVRGGARLIGPLSFAERRQSAPRAKARIAAKLSKLLPASGAVAFDASSTVMRLAGMLEHARDLTVLTNGPDTFAALGEIPGVTAVLTGGRLEPRTGSLVGPLACRAAAQLTVEMLFMSAAAVDTSVGALEMSLDEAEVKRAVAMGAGEVVLAADSSKLGGRALALGIDWDRIDVLVTDLDPQDDRLDPYRSLAEVM